MNFKIKHFNQLNTDILYRILKARIDVFVVEQNCPYAECDNKDQQSYHLYYEENEEIAAYLRILPAGLSYSEPSIGRVLVAEKFRRKRYAEKMMKTAAAFIKEKFAADSIRISAQKYLNDFYQSLGYKNVSEVYLEDGIPHIEMLLEF
ncbi:MULTISPECIES: GNAT family N-acetyltransferase [unclassified Halanaerobium]|uniref:GNAT family N-acetyltransferase n=1 Tax=unclassified Halanaerobium TaxID=2641197 RepID=UPI000DF4304D|nr:MULTISPECIES: GNAT family N-acetyltransferase [unclassified Halanaerobium]RCW47736.1 ElaA protein [Halanaerobium sp. MA284_MarDTE_T2]RCW87977.1 ElaA protein [Halanaerobium sp. DL-01]